KGDHAGALAVLRSTPDAQQSLLEVQRQLAYELLRTGALDEALAATQPAMKAGASAGMRYLRAMIIAAMGRTAEAEQEMSALHQASPDNVDLAIDLARLRERQGRASEAEAALRETLDAVGHGEDRPEDRSRLRFVLAAVCQRAKDWKGAEDAIRPMLDPQMPAALRDAALELQADLLADQGHGEEAVKLLAGRDDVPALIAKRAEIELRLGHRVEAQSALEGLAKSDDVDRQLLAAETYQRVDDYAASVPVLESARARKPESRDIAFRLGAAYERTGRRDDALRVFRDLVHAHANYAPALNYLGYMLAEKREALDEALDLARRAVAIEPDNGAYVDSLGWAYYQRGEYREAQTALERANQLVPDDATIREHLGDVYRAAGDVVRARQAYEQALKLGGDNREALERKLRELTGGS
ncbi:MAG: tetratricopeptide repeat protein, partial [Acidobacteriota bacterium]